MMARQIDELAVYRKRREERLNPPPGSFEYRTSEKRPPGGYKLQFLGLWVPHEMPPGFPFHDIPTELMVQDIPMIHCLRQLGLNHMIDHVPIARNLLPKLQDNQNG